MKLIRRVKDRFVFQLSRREKAVLLKLFELYPCVPPAHYRLSRSSELPDLDASQRLLDEALAEQRAENKKQLQSLLDDPERWTEKGTSWQFSLSSSDIEWLLQILNDIRIGNWVRLGSPEEWAEVVNEKTAPNIMAMELAGHIQAFLLTVLEGGET